ncbi:hypothetical protein K438DRAFT_1014880 [Mycena galopus ATCC 62051]|nr:hypothetical protein K438DRAFT_1014880 [Mycena galopus ATCC 62051]
MVRYGSVSPCPRSIVLVSLLCLQPVRPEWPPRMSGPWWYSTVRYQCDQSGLQVRNERSVVVWYSTVVRLHVLVHLFSLILPFCSRCDHTFKLKSCYSPWY